MANNTYTSYYTGSTIDGYIGSIPTLEAKVSTLMTAKDQASSDINILTSRINSAQGSISSLQTTTNSQASLLSTHSEQIKTNSNDITEIQKTFDGIQTQLAAKVSTVDFNSYAKTVNDRIEKLESDSGSSGGSSGSMDESVSNRFSALEAKYQTLSNDVSDLSATVSSNSKAIVELQQKNTILEQSIKTNAANIESLNEQLSDFQTKADATTAHNELKQTMAESENSLREELAALSEAVNNLLTLQKEINTLKEQISTLEAANNELQTQIDALKQSKEE